MTLEQAKDTVIALSFGALLIAFVWDTPAFVRLAFVLLLLGLLVPALFKLPARLWFGLGEVLGRIATPVILSAVFALAIVPVGTVRRMLGHDSLRLRQWKAGSESVFETRDHTFEARDLTRPF